MEEIKVNEYIRTENGHIDKIINIERYNEEEKWLVGENFRKGLDNGYYGRTTDNDILKHSLNIIDLIEKDDYVNGEQIIQVSKTFGLLFIGTTYYDEKSGEEKHNFIRQEDIKTIVTKEQFKRVMYEVK